MFFYYKRALQDIRDNRFLSAVTIITIAISVLIVSTFILFFANANEMMNAWRKGVRVMAYLKPGIPELEIPEIKLTIQGMYGVEEVKFISKKDALEHLKAQLKRQASLLDNLKENPLPDAFEIQMTASSQSQDKIEVLANRIESLPQVEEVEYGQKWLGRFTNVFNLFKLAGYAMGGLFFIAAVFIVANTIRLVLYSRREEVEIMRLVGATNGFIKAPFYIEGLIQGLVGGVFGIAALFVTFLFVSSNIEQGFSSGLFTVRFLSPAILCGTLFCSMFVGWLGCYLSLRQFLK